MKSKKDIFRCSNNRHFYGIFRIPSIEGESCPCYLHRDFCLQHTSLNLQNNVLFLASELEITTSPYIRKENAKKNRV